MILPTLFLTITTTLLALAAAQDNSTAATTASAAASSGAPSNGKACQTEECCTALDCNTCLKTSGCHFCDEVVKPKQPPVPPTCKMMCREGPTLNKCTSGAAAHVLSFAAAAAALLAL